MTNTTSASLPAAPLAGRRGIVINDNPGNLHRISLWLEQAGMTVRGFRTAFKAVEHLNAAAADIVITDLHMPCIDGWRFCRLLRSPECAALNRIPILITSNTFSGEDIEEITSEVGANGFLPFPCESVRLVNAVSAMLSGRTPGLPVDMIVVDPNPIRAGAVREAFEQAGHRLQQACTADKAERLIAAHCPDALIVAADVPEDAIRRLIDGMKREASHGVALVLIERPDSATALRLLQAGADSYLQWPCEKARMFEVYRQTRRARSMLRIKDLLRDQNRRLRESEAHYRRLMEQTHAGVITLDSQGCIVFVNATMCQILEKTSDELVGRRGADFLVPSQDPTAQSPIGIREHTFVRKDGAKVHMSLSISPLTDDDDGQRGYIIVAIDISAQKRSAEAQSQLEKKLMHAEKMEAIGTLAGGIAHDFNNVLAIILGLAELMEMSLPADNPQREHLLDIIGAANRARELVDQILCFCRQGPQEPATIKLNALIRETARFLRSSIPSTIDIRTDIAVANDMTCASPSQIQRILMNLCTNAAHTMRERGGTLSIALANIAVTSDDIAQFPELSPGHYLKLSTGDTGHGIDPAIMPKIFDPYFTTKKPGEGTGMGLAVVHGIVASLKGAIRVDSVIGQGTVFTVYLPCHRQTSCSAIAHQERPFQGHGRLGSAPEIGLNVISKPLFLALSNVAQIRAPRIYPADSPRSSDR